MKTCLLLIVLVFASFAFSDDGTAKQSNTTVVVLGTGTPSADPERSGPSVAVVVNDHAYLVDCGPGVVRRAAAAEKNGFEALKPTQLNIVFMTHLHSDHTLGFPDLIFSPWVLGRKEPVQAYGPRGLRSMTRHIEKAWGEDIRIRRNGLEQANATGYKVVVHEISPGRSIVTRTSWLLRSRSSMEHGSTRLDIASKLRIAAL